MFLFYLFIFYVSLALGFLDSVLIWNRVSVPNPKPGVFTCTRTRLFRFIYCDKSTLIIEGALSKISQNLAGLGLGGAK